MLGNFEQMANYDFDEIPRLINIAGVTWENRQLIITKLNNNSQIPVLLVRDYENKHDKNAIAVKLEDNTQIGWIPRRFASILAPEIDAGIKWNAVINEIVGSEDTIKGVQIKLYFSE